jgi:hypothetical protein
MSIDKLTTSINQRSAGFGKAVAVFGEAYRAAL